MREFKLEDYAVSSLKLVVFKSGNRQHCNQVEHCHNCVEMMYIIQGAGICNVNGKPHTVSRGSLFVMSPDDTHEYQVERDFIYYNILFFPDLFTEDELGTLRSFPNFDQWLFSAPAADKKFQFLPPLSDELETMINDIAGEFKQRQAGFELSARAAFIRFMVFLLRSLNKVESSPQTPINSDSAITRTIYYINRNFHKQLTLKSMAKTAGISISTLSRCFRETTGDSPIDYLGKVRAGKAQFELTHTRKPISQIAIDLGYCDSSYFSRSFRRFTGISPREYRKRREL